jgi:hypothetical protein
MAKQPWYRKGEEGRKKSEQVDKEQKQRRSRQRGPIRFWQDNDQSCKALFLDNPDFFFHEHNLRIDGRWFNYETCLKERDTCPPCENGETSSYVVAGTCIAFKPWEDGEGNKHKIQKMLFVAKGKARQNLLRQIGYREGDLSMSLYEVARGSSATEANTGEDFEFLRKLTDTQLRSVIPEGDIPKEYKGDVDKFLAPFDYEKVFAPKTAKALRELVGGETPVGAEEEDDVSDLLDTEEETPAEEEVTSIDDLI